MNRVETKPLIALFWIALGLSMVGCQTMPFGGGNGMNGMQQQETRVGRQVGSIVGSQIVDHGYVGSMVGGMVGSGAEKAVTNKPQQ